MTVVDSDFNIDLDPDENLSVNNNCNYYTIDEYNAKHSDLVNSYSLYNQNVRSFHSKRSQIESFLDTVHLKFHAIVLTETWNSANNVDLCYLENYSGVHNFRDNAPHRGGPGGGVSIFSNSSLYTIRKLDELCLCNATIETCVVEVCCRNDPSKNHIILGVYRPHDDNIQNFTIQLADILSHNLLQNKSIIISGDMNINILASNNDSIDEYLNMLNCFHFVPAITKPTRFAVNGGINTGTSLDHIFINRLLPFSSAIFSYDLSDHCGTAIAVSLYDPDVYMNKSYKHIFRPYLDNNFQALRDKVSETNWDVILESDDVNNQYEKFISYLDVLYCKYFPLKIKYISAKRKNNPWITNSIYSKIRKKSEYYRMFKNGQISRAENNSFKNRLNKEIQKAKNAYYLKLFNDARNNMKSSWKILRSLLGAKSKIDGLSEILMDKADYDEKFGIINQFNNYFSSVGANLSAKFENNEAYVSSFPVNINSFYLFPPSEIEILKLISKLKLSKTHINSMPVSIFRKLSDLLVKPILLLINKSFQTGIFPEILKLARITPLHKTDDYNTPSNYRPISSLSYHSKIFEKLIANRLISFCKKFNIFSPEQFGFQPGVSTCDALIKLTEAIYQSLDEKNHHIITLIDIRKAFDCVDHAILSEKLDRYGIRGFVHNLFVSYLSNRKCFIEINNIKSDVKTFNVGVPQGSVLGPILFLLYVNDLPKISNNFQTVLFADDTTISTTGKDSNELLYRTNSELNRVSNWTKSNKLTLNTSKTELMIITNRNFASSMDVTLTNEVIRPTASCKFLGVMLDDKLSFKEHISFILKKISRHSGILYKIRDGLPLQTRLNYYYSFIYPYISYNIVVWGGTYSTCLQPLIVQQKRTIRIIKDAGYSEHSSPLFKELNLLKVVDIYKYYLLIYMFKAKTKGEFSITHLRNTRNRDFVLPVFHRLEMTQHAVSFMAPKTWNSLPLTLRKIEKLG